MAIDVQKRVQIAFEGDDQISKTLNSINSNFQGFASSVGSATQPLADITDALLIAEAAFAALAIGGMAYAVTKAGEFSDSFNEITTLIDAPTTAINEFKDQIIDYARNSVLSIDQINESLYNAISAGEDYTTALDYLGQSEKFAIATKGDLNEATVLLKQTVNAYGSDTITAGQAADIYFQTIESGVTRVDLLSASMGKVIPTAAALNVPLETLGAAMIGLTKSGVETSEAVTELNSLFTAFIKPTSQAQAIAKDLGIQFNANTIESLGFEGALQMVYDATDGNVEVLGRLLGRKEALNAMLILGADNSHYFADALEDMKNATGAVDEAYKKMVDNFELLNQRLINNLQATLIELGTPLLDDWANIANGIIEIFKGVSISFDDHAFDPLFEEVEKLATQLSEYLKGIGEALPEAFALIDWDAFIGSIDDVIKEVGDLFDAFFGDLDLTDPEDLAKAIQKIVDTFESLNEIVAGVLHSFEPFVREIGNMIDRFNAMDDSTKESSGEFLGLGKVINSVSGFIGDLSGALDLATWSLGILAGGQTINTLITVFGKFGSSLTPVLTSLGQFAIYGASFGVGWLIGDWMRENIPIVDQFATGLANVILKFQGLDEENISSIEAQAAHTKAMGDAAVAAVLLAEKVDDIPAEKTVKVGTQDFQGTQEQFNEMLDLVKAIPAEKNVKLAAEVDENQVHQEFNKIYEVTDEGLLVEIGVVPAPGTEKTISDVLEEIPPEKVLELKLQSDVEVQLASIETSAENVQAALKYKAEVDVAEIEAARDIMLGISSDLTEAFVSSGDVISAAVGELSNLGALAQLELFDVIEKEQQTREELAQAEIELSQAQIEYLNARTAALESGQAIVNITLDGVYPELEAIMWKIIERVQIQATEEGLEFLLGL